jgi:PPM family protein phosphatase
MKIFVRMFFGEVQLNKKLVGILSDVGKVRPKNQDSAACVDFELKGAAGTLALVCDGMGGHQAGEVASQLAIQTILETFSALLPTRSLPETITESIYSAHEKIIRVAAENEAYFNMGTTVVVAAIVANTAVIANVGDSRAYLISDKQIRQLSIDHSQVAELLRSGAITAQEAVNFPKKNILMQSLCPTVKKIKVDVCQVEVKDQDAILLCSDGLWGLVPDETICSVTNQHLPQEACQHLIDLAKNAGGHDNISAVIIRSQNWQPPKESFLKNLLDWTGLK